MNSELKKELFKYYYLSNACHILKDFDLTKQEIMALVIIYYLSRENENVSLKEIREKQ